MVAIVDTHLRCAAGRRQPAGEELQRGATIETRDRVLVHRERVHGRRPSDVYVIVAEIDADWRARGRNGSLELESASVALKDCDCAGAVVNSRKYLTIELPDAAGVA